MSWVIKFTFNGFRNISRQTECFRIVNFLRLHHNANLAARLDCKRFLYAFERLGNFFELLQTTNVSFQRLTSCSRSSRRQSVSRTNQHRNNRSSFTITMVGSNTVDNNRMLFILLSQFHADFDMRSFHFMIKRFTDVMQ
ncbi:hypothetical protein D3C81_1417670 [compost metagenome]